MSEKSEKSDSRISKNAHPMIFGSVTVGSRGQVVIPKDARLAYDIQDGDRLVLFGTPKGIMLAKADALRQMAKKMLEHLG